MVAHQAIGVAFSAKLLETGRDDLQELPPVSGVDEDGLFSIASRHQMIDGATEYDAVSSGHAGIGSKAGSRGLRRVLRGDPSPPR